MKVIAIGRNYVDHAKELNNPIPQEPVVFMKPDTALLKDNKDFYYPEFSNDIHYEAEIILRICKEGKHVSQKFANTYLMPSGSVLTSQRETYNKNTKRRVFPGS